MQKIVLAIKLLYRIAMIGFLCLFANAGEVAAAENTIKIVQNGIIKGNLVMRFQANDVFSEKVVKFLNRGFTVKMEYNIELWRSRDYWFDRLDSQQNIGYEISFEPLEKQYRCIKTRNGITIASRIEKQLAKVASWVTMPDNPLNIAPLATLDPESRYYYNIELLIATLTTENIKDLQRWMGEFEEKDEEPSSLAKTSFKVVADFLSSRNHKRISLRSGRFVPYELPEIEK